MKPEVSRRDFLNAGSVSAGAVALGGLAPARALGASERIHFGCVGAGAMGSGHLKRLVQRSEEDNVRAVAVCDVYQKRLNRAIRISKADGCLDYRRLLDRKDVDAVLIATPDHWHARIAIEAMQAGKHVYCEKPMTLTVEQALEVRNAVRRYNKILQVGPQATGDDEIWQARETIRAGRIGKVTWAHAGWNRNGRECAFNAPPFLIDPAAGPDAAGENFIDWDMWLGHKFGLAAKIPYNPEHFFRFRKYWAYGGGVATDLLYHKLAPLLLAIAGPDGEYPLRVNASGGLYVEKDGRDIPDVFFLTIDYPGEYSIFLESVLTNDSHFPTRIYGKYGSMEVSGGLNLEVNRQFEREFKEKNHGHTGVRIARNPRRDMVGNFIDVIRGQGALNCNAELGAATMVAIKLGVEAYRQSKTMLWDPNKEKSLS